MLKLLFLSKKERIYQRLEEEKKMLEKNDYDYQFILKETKHGEPVLLYWSDDVEVVKIIHLLGIFRGRPTHSQINLNFRRNEMILADIQVLNKKVFNRGYGSVLLEIALNEAKKRNISIVTGELMTENEFHFQRQKHFYEKHGFKIIDKSKLYLEL